MKQPILILIGFLTFFPRSFAQNAPYPFKGSATLKLNAVGGNFLETAHGAAFQYYTGNAIGLQLNVDYLHIANSRSNNSGKHINGDGIRIMPEFRYYTLRSDRSNYVSFYWSAAFMAKYNVVRVGAWNTIFDEVTGTMYETYNRAVNTVTAFGFMPQVGIEAYLDKQRRFLIDGTLGLGLAKNYIRREGDEIARRDWDGFLFSNNQYEGWFPYLNMKIALGYRILR